MLPTLTIEDGARAARTPRAVEGALVVGLKRGDERAYEELVRTYGKRLHAVVGRYVRPLDRVEDALQDVWMSVHRSIATFDERSTLTTWLHRVAVNAALMILRTERRRPTVRLEDLTPEGGEAAVRRPPARTVCDEIMDAEDVARLRSLVSEHLIVAFHVAGHTSRNVARELGVSTSTVRTRLHQSRAVIAIRCGLPPPSHVHSTLAARA